MAGRRVVLPEDQRDKIGRRHAAELEALAEHATAQKRLVAAEARRVEVLAVQDQLVVEAVAARLAAAAVVGELIGATAAADLTGVPVVELRRALAERKAKR